MKDFEAAWIQGSEESFQSKLGTWLGIVQPKWELNHIGQNSQESQHVNARFLLTCAIRYFFPWLCKKANLTSWICFFFLLQHGNHNNSTLTCNSLLVQTSRYCDVKCNQCHDERHWVQSRGDHYFRQWCALWHWARRRGGGPGVPGREHSDTQRLVPPHTDTEALRSCVQRRESTRWADLFFSSPAWSGCCGTPGA